jgi:hypothetical protein
MSSRRVDSPFELPSVDGGHPLTRAERVALRRASERSRLAAATPDRVPASERPIVDDVRETVPERRHPS